MAVERILIDQFIKLSLEHLVVDVRSPSEFQHAHFSGALSVPLFDDEERKVIGTTYKQRSREKAIKIGLDFYGVKMKAIIEQVESELKKRDSKTVIVYCWRGGMRSSAIAWLLDLYGFKVYQLEGGYKVFRNWVLGQLKSPWNLRILSGHTGSGKTKILYELEKQNYPVIDLEGMAGHKGSTFGNLELISQCSNEFFENKLALKLYFIATHDLKSQEIWIESESSRIGNININIDFFNQMKKAPRVNIIVPFEKRLDYITEEYGVYDKEEIIHAIERIHKRLGGLETQRAIAFVEEGDLKSAFEILLIYYDRFYDKSTLFQPAFLEIELPDTNPLNNTQLILENLK
jgi:tRNA 2-selenouridine synthase